MVVYNNSAKYQIFFFVYRLWPKYIYHLSQVPYPKFFYNLTKLGIW